MTEQLRIRGASSIEAPNSLQNLRPHYRTGEADLARDFFEPCLNYCSEYRRAAGFFSSSALVTWANVLPRLARDADVKVDLLISPVLSEQDRLAIQRATIPSEREKLLQECGDRIVIEATDFAASPHDVQLRLKLLALMIASRKLELRFAFPSHIEEPGLFHEKIGIFVFPDDRKVAFTGSANESTSGHTRNYESIDVFRSWIPEDAARVDVKNRQFAEAWGGSAQGLTVVPLSQRALELIQLRGEGSSAVPESPENSVEVNKWRHQTEAIDVFLRAERGILEMATGTGKTRTAVRIFETLVRQDRVSTLIVAADGTDLLNQWYKQLLEVTRYLPSRFAVVRHYDNHHEQDRFALDPERKVLIASRPTLRSALRRLPAAVGERTLLIHDEVHRLGSPNNRETLLGLADGVRYRLGLSATPEREYDEVGNAFIESHIGPVIVRFDLGDAIRRRILSPFNYHALSYTPNDDDRYRLQQVYVRAAAREQSGNPMTQEELWIELAKVYKTSRAKLPVFRNFIHEHAELLARCIIFVETREYGEEVLEIVHSYRHDFHTYYATEDSTTLQRFASGELECLVTCHRLSEGIDIQSLQNVILFSSARARLETIQRMGRCLRWDPRNPGKRANVVDFVRSSDPDTEDATADEERRDWLEALSRIAPGGE